MKGAKIILFLLIIAMIIFTASIEYYVYLHNPAKNATKTVITSTDNPDVAYLRQQLNNTETDLKDANNLIEMYENTYGKIFYTISVPSCSVIPDTFYLANNITSKNVSWKSLTDFLYYEDFTDMKIYNENYRSCGDYAEELHNNAEAHGIRASYVQVEFEDGSVGHAMNAFLTTDYGLQFIDDTGSSSPNDTNNHDKVCSVIKGEPMGCMGITGEMYGSAGIVKDYEIFW